jgi:hypothetical protein
MPNSQYEEPMSTLTQVEKPMEAVNEVSSADGRRERQIRTKVLASLGHPVELLKVAVLPLWGDKFRVNVWTRGLGTTIPHSYFVTADDRGAILRAEPPIHRLH